MCVAWIQVFAGYIASLRLLTNMLLALPPFPGHFAPPKWNMGTQKKNWLRIQVREKSSRPIFWDSIFIAWTCTLLVCHHKYDV